MAQDSTDQTGDRTFEPTPMRLADARKRGQVPRSADLTAAAAGLAALLVLVLVAPGLLDEMTSMTKTMLDGRGMELNPARDDIGQVISSAAGGAIARTAGLMAAIAGFIAVVAFAQVGPIFARERIEADWGRVSIAAGWQRLLSSRTVVRGVFAIAKVVAVAAVAWWTAGPMLEQILAAPRLGTSLLVGKAGSMAVTVMLRAGLCLLVLGLVEYVYQRWQHKRDLRMTRHEWLEDMKRADGGGAKRMRRRQLTRQVAVRRVGEVTGASGSVRTKTNQRPRSGEDDDNG